MWIYSNKLFNFLPPSSSPFCHLDLFLFHSCAYQMILALTPHFPPSSCSWSKLKHKFSGYVKLKNSQSKNTMSRIEGNNLPEGRQNNLKARGSNLEKLKNSQLRFHLQLSLQHTRNSSLHEIYPPLGFTALTTTSSNCLSYINKAPNIPLSKSVLLLSKLAPENLSSTNIIQKANQSK